MNQRSGPSTTNIALGLSSGPAIIGLTHVVVSLLGGRPLDIADEFLFLIFQVLWTSLPFLAIMLTNPTSLRPWVFAIGSTAALYAYAVVDAYVRREEGSGANIGLGLLMFIWPPIATIVSILLAKRRR
jgi:hypothetical protein